MFEISFENSYNLEKTESELKLLFKLLKATSKFNKLKIEASSLNAQTFVELIE
jgi:hypothetical protein